MQCRQRKGISPTALLFSHALFLFRGLFTAHKFVNIFHERASCTTRSLSTHYKTYAFAFQKRRFCTVKAAVLHRKTAAFAIPNRNCRFSFRTFFTKAKPFSNGLVLKILEILGELDPLHTTASLSPQPPSYTDKKNAKALRFSIFLFLFSSSNPLYVSTWEGGE